MRFIKGAFVVTVFMLVVALISWGAAGCADSVCSGPAAPPSCQG